VKNVVRANFGDGGDWFALELFGMAVVVVIV
jgi:hypothetical protein